MSIAWLLVCAGCTPIPQPDRDRGPELAEWKPPAVGDPFPDLDLKGSGGRLIERRALQDRITVVALVGLDPVRPNADSGLILERLIELPNRVPAPDLQLFAVSLTPVAANPPHPIELLTGEADRLRDLAANFGVFAERVDDVWVHGHCTVVVGRTGRITAILHGVASWDAATLAAAVAAAR